MQYRWRFPTEVLPWALIDTLKNFVFYAPVHKCILHHLCALFPIRIAPSETNFSPWGVTSLPFLSIKVWQPVVKPTKNQTGLSLNTGHTFIDYLTLSQLVDLSEPKFFHLFYGDKSASIGLNFKLKDIM